MMEESRTKKKKMEEEESRGTFESLPEGCISHVLSLTSPRDSCRSSVISSTFRSAAASDTVWEKFLPSDCNDILSRAVDSVEYSSKKELYFRLCDSILIDGGKMSFALEKRSGGKCYMLSARELGIAWGDTPRYWKWISLPKSRFAEVAQLIDVCWLEIEGKIDSRMLTPKTIYAAYLIFKLVAGARGFCITAQKASVKVGAHESSNKLYLEPFDARMNIASIRLLRRNIDFPRYSKYKMKGAKAPHARSDGWMEIEMGECFNDCSEERVVHMRFLEVEEGHWKSGLIVQGIEIRPKK